MISRRESLLVSASIFSSACFGEAAFAQSEKDPPFKVARDAVGKRACERCDDRGQVQKAVAGGSTASSVVQGMPGTTWLQEGYVLCPDCLGESKEYRTAISQYKDGVLPWVELAKKRIEKLKADGKFESIKKRAKEAQPEASMFPQVQSLRSERFGRGFQGEARNLLARQSAGPFPNRDIDSRRGAGGDRSLGRIRRHRKGGGTRRRFQPVHRRQSAADVPRFAGVRRIDARRQIPRAVRLSAKVQLDSHSSQ